MKIFEKMRLYQLFFILTFFLLVCLLVVAEHEENIKTSSGTIAGLILSLPFEEGSTSTWTEDCSSYKNNGAVNGAYWNATGGYDGKGAYQFDGDEDYINIEGSNLNTKQKMTVMAWVKFKDANDNIIVAGGDGVESDDYYLGIYDSADPANKISFGVWETLSWTTVSWNTPSLNSWYYIAGVYDSTHLMLYINGSLVDTVELTDEWPINIEYVRIGQLFHGKKASFHGTIDNVRIYNRALSAGQIRSFYESGLMAANTVLKHQFKNQERYQKVGEQKPAGLLNTVLTKKTQIAIKPFNLKDESKVNKGIHKTQ